MNHDMIYNGQLISWPGWGSFKASSGLPEYQTPTAQCIPDSGPLPEGNYFILLTNLGAAQDDNKNICNLKPAWGIQSIPRGADAGACEQYWANWGNNRARMEPADSGTKNRCAPTMRGGFYIHDSTKGYSHGCIEVEPRIFSLMRTFHKTSKKSKLLIKILYEGKITNGGTKI